MKRLISLTLAILTVLSLLAACAPAADQLDPAITLASSDATAKAEWLDERLDVIPDNLIIGIGSNEKYGVDMSDFDEDGYIARAVDGDVLLFGASAEGLDRAVREYAKAADVSATAELDTVYHEGARIKELTIAGRSISEFTVVYTYEEKVSTPSFGGATLGNAKYAAQQTVRLIEEATGITLPMQAEDADGPMIKFDYLPEDGTYGEQAFNYEVKDGNIYINGMGRSNGCAFGVYFFLERECGWGGLVYGDSELQEADCVNIPDGASYSAAPLFEWYWMREMYNCHYESDRADINYQGRIWQQGNSMSGWLGFQLEEVDEPLCYNDENVYKTVYASISEYIGAMVSAGRDLSVDTLTLDTCGPDSSDHCVCSYCKKVYNEEGKAHIGSAVRFMNRLDADMDALGYDGVHYMYYAYAGLNKPPRLTVPSDDCYIEFCSDGSCYVHLMDGSECGSGFANYSSDMKKVNEIYAQWLEDWCGISDNIYIYFYLLENLFHEYTYMDNLYEDIHYLADIGVKGYQPEVQYMGFGLGRLRFQLMYYTIWHPEMTKSEYEIMKGEIMEREYGDGWSFVEDFIGIWAECEENLGCLSCWDFSNLFRDDQYDPYMYGSRSEEMYQLLERARKLTENETQERNVERLLLLVIGNQCYTTYFDVYERNDTERMAVLEERWDLLWQYAKHSNMENQLLDIDGYSSWAQSRPLNRNLHIEAWNCWSQTNNYYGEGEATREMPDWVTATES